MSEPTYPFSGTNFKAHKIAMFALGAVIILIAVGMGYIFDGTYGQLPKHSGLVIAVSATVSILVLIVLFATFKPDETARYINERERIEDVLIRLIGFIDINKTLNLEQKRVLLEWYINEMGYLNWPLAAEHLKHVDFKAGGSMHQILDAIQRETAAEVIKKIGENGGVLPHQQVDVLNGRSMLYSNIKEVIQL